MKAKGHQARHLIASLQNHAHLTLENIQTSSTSSLVRGEGFETWAEGRRAGASLHAEELCCFGDS